MMEKEVHVAFICFFCVIGHSSHTSSSLPFVFPTQTHTHTILCLSMKGCLEHRYFGVFPCLLPALLTHPMPENSAHGNIRTCPKFRARYTSLSSGETMLLHTRAQNGLHLLRTLHFLRPLDFLLLC